MPVDDSMDEHTSAMHAVTHRIASCRWVGNSARTTRATEEGMLKLASVVLDVILNSGEAPNSVVRLSITLFALIGARLPE